MQQFKDLFVDRKRISMGHIILEGETEVYGTIEGDAVDLEIFGVMKLSQDKFFMLRKFRRS